MYIFTSGIKPAEQHTNAIINTARIACGKVCVAVGRPSVSSFARLLRRVCCWAHRGQAGDIDRLLHGRRLAARSAANASSVALTAVIEF